MTSFRRTLTYAIAALIVSASANAQTPAAATRARAAEPTSLAQPNTSGALALEMLGGSVGSLVGIGIVGLTAHCGIDDLGCVILNVGAGGALGVVGATIGTTLVARQTGSRRSIAGASLGALVGTGAGLGIHYLLNQNSDRNLGDAVVVPIFVVAQGTFAALGSRLLGR